MRPSRRGGRFISGGRLPPPSAKGGEGGFALDRAGGRAVVWVRSNVGGGGDWLRGVRAIPKNESRPGRLDAGRAAFSLRERLKAAGGRWDPERKIWRVRYGSIRGDVELEEGIFKD